MQAVFAYVRVSTVRQGEKGVSLQEQRSAISEYATKNNLRVAEWFEELETAASQGRTVFTALIKRLRLSRNYGLVVHKIDRSARNLKDWALIQDLIDGGISVHFAHESLDLKTRGGRLAADIQAVVAADYIRNLRDEVKKGMYGRLKQGFYPFKAPIGYLDCGSGKSKIIDPIKGPLVRQAFELYVDGSYTVDMLRGEMFRRGLTGKNGKELTLGRMSAMLNNPFYYGLIRIQINGESYVGNHDPLISKSLYERVQAHLNSKTQWNGIVHNLTFRKFIPCGTCARFLIGERQKSYVYYRCHTKTCKGTNIKEEALVEQFRENLRSLRINEYTLEVLQEEVAALLVKDHQTRAERIKSSRMQSSLVEERLQQLANAYLDQQVDLETYTNQREMLLNKRILLREEATKMGSETSAKRTHLATFVELTKTIHSKLECLDFAELRQMVVWTSSNYSFHQKTIVFKWRNGFHALALGLENTDGDPNQARCRRALEEVLSGSN